jgi:flavodoxin
MKTLVVFYSRTGNTSLVASKIAALLGADTDRILSAQGYDGSLGFMRGVLHSISDRRVVIDPPKITPAGYDLVVIGGPVWAGRAANPVRTYLRQFGDTFKQVAYFVTLGGASAEKALAHMETVTGKRPLSTLAVPQKDIASGNYDLAARNFARSLQQAMGQPHAEVA